MEPISHWINEDGVKCIGIESLLEKLCCLDEEDMANIKLVIEQGEESEEMRETVCMLIRALSGCLVT